VQISVFRARRAARTLALSWIVQPSVRQMDQKSIGIYLHMKGMNETEIHAHLVKALEDEAMHYATITAYLRSTSFTSSTDPTPEGPLAPENDEVDETILLALGEEPFTSIRQLARATHSPKTTVYRRLTQKLDFTVRHLRWVPRTLSEGDKPKGAAFGSTSDRTPASALQVGARHCDIR
jgi:hypothetical protein